MVLIHSHYYITITVVYLETFHLPRLKLYPFSPPLSPCTHLTTFLLYEFGYSRFPKCIIFSMSKLLCWREKHVAEIATVNMRTLLGEPQVTSFTLSFCYFWVHSGKQVFCGIPDSRTVPRMGAQSLLNGLINLWKQYTMWQYLKTLKSLYLWWDSNFCVLYYRRLTSSNNRPREDSWLKSLFVRKVDPRKDAHSNLLAKKETSSLYKLQCEW